MTLKRKMTREIACLFVICGISLLFWVCIACITEQNIIAHEFQYARERNAFLITIPLVYFLRLNLLKTKPPAHS